MKFRTGFVTNSSSSSFIVSKSQLSKDKAIDFMNEYAWLQYKWYWADEDDDEDIVEPTVAVGKYRCDYYDEAIMNGSSCMWCENYASLYCFDAGEFLTKSKSRIAKYGEDIESEEIEDAINALNRNKKHPDTDFWYFTNDGNCRLGWDDIDELSEKYKFDYVRGYCD